MNLASSAPVAETTTPHNEQVFLPPFWITVVARLVWYPLGLVVPVFPVILLAVGMLGLAGPTDPRGPNPGAAMLMVFTILGCVIGIPISFLVGGICSYVLSRRELLLVPGVATLGWTLYIVILHIMR